MRYSEAQKYYNDLKDQKMEAIEKIVGVDISNELRKGIAEQLNNIMTGKHNSFALSKDLSTRVQSYVVNSMEGKQIDQLANLKQLAEQNNDKAKEQFKKLLGQIKSLNISRVTANALGEHVQKLRASGEKGFSGSDIQNRIISYIRILLSGKAKNEKLEDLKKQELAIAGYMHEAAVWSAGISAMHNLFEHTGTQTQVEMIGAQNTLTDVVLKILPRSATGVGKSAPIDIPTQVKLYGSTDDTGEVVPVKSFYKITSSSDLRKDWDALNKSLFDDPANESFFESNYKKVFGDNLLYVTNRGVTWTGDWIRIHVANNYWLNFQSNNENSRTTIGWRKVP